MRNENSLNNSSFGKNGGSNFKLLRNALSPKSEIKTGDDVYIYKHTYHKEVNLLLVSVVRPLSDEQNKIQYLFLP